MRRHGLQTHAFRTDVFTRGKDYMRKANERRDQGDHKGALDAYWNARDCFNRSDAREKHEWALKADRMIGELGGVRIFQDTPSIAKTEVEPNWGEAAEQMSEALDRRKVGGHGQ